MAAYNTRSRAAATADATTTIKMALIAHDGERAATNVVVDAGEAQRILTRFQMTIDETKSRFPTSKVVVCKLDLSCRVWTPDAITILRPLLELIAPTLEILKMNGIVKYRWKEEEVEDGWEAMSLLSDIFSRNCRVLQELNVNDNALGTRGLEKLKPLVLVPTITCLYLENCCIAHEDATEMLRECLDGRPLTQVALGPMNNLGVRGAICVGQSLTTSKLEYFSYRYCHPVTRDGTLGLLQGLVAADTSNLLHLDLTFVDFRTSLDLLAQVLTKSPHLKSLLLRSGVLEGDRLRSVLQALYASRAKLQLLDFGGNFVNDDDDDDEENNTTKRLQLATELGQFLSTQCSTLETLVLDNSELQNDGMLALIAASGPLFAGAERTVLRKLSLDNCRLTGSNVLRVLAHNPITTLQELVLTNNDLDAGSALKMLQKVYSTVIVKVDDVLWKGD